MLRDVRVLAEKQQVFDAQTDEQRHPGHAQDHRRAGDRQDPTVDRQQHRQVPCDRPPILRPGEQAAEPGQVPVVVDPIQDGKERDPEAPARVDERALGAPQRPRHERLGRRIEVLPAGPLVVAPVHPNPGVVRNQREERRQPSGEGVIAPRPEQRVVPALVQDHEPLDEHQGEQRLPGKPECPAVRERERDPDRRAPQRERDDPQSRGVGGSEV